MSSQPCVKINNEIEKVEKRLLSFFYIFTMWRSKVWQTFEINTN